ncbi:MAG: hypothetical protein EP329_24140 [Deltaproteobacteria bacterium]|nr:MAG: hypothetical protein EP329_24140 [Deltaproteobacteria bacterium]
MGRDLHGFALGAALWLGGCAAGADGGPAGEVAISVAPLQLDSLTDATYTLAVYNGASQLVWSRSSLRSTAFGDGAGSLSYVGTCDADSNPNVIRLTLEELEGSGGPLPVGDWVNPTPIERTFPCVADEDVAVAFELTVLQRARQGFFDVAVSFDDVFCSAKLDCCVEEGGACTSDIALLHDDAGARGTTFVLGFACTAGPFGDALTTLCLDDLELDCTDPEGADAFDPPDLVLSPGGDPAGNQCTAGAMGACTDAVTELSAVQADDLLYQLAVYRGTEALTSAGVDAEKVYWNVALGVRRPAVAGCRLRARATADDGLAPALTLGAIPADRVYPVVVWDADLGACQAEPLTLNDPTAAVRAEYDAGGGAFASCFAPPGPPTPPGERQASCVGLPTNATWNTVDTITQTWSGAAWEPTATAVFDATPSTTECRFRCVDNYAWSGAACDPIPNPPSLATLIPDHGSLGGQEETLLWGAGFVSGATVTIGGEPAAVVSTSSTVLRVIVPAGLVDGLHDVRVTNPDTGTVTLVGGYEVGAARTVTHCRASGTTTVSTAAYTHAFTASECYGALPPADAQPGVGWASSTDGILTFRAYAGATPSERILSKITGSRNYFTTSVYLPASNAILCSSTFTAGAVTSMTRTFTAADCGGVLPDASYVGVIQRLEPCGGAITFRVLDAGQGGPGVFFASTSTVCATNSVLSAVYYPRADVIVCAKAIPTVVGDGLAQLDFSASDCGGTLPDVHYAAMLRRIQVCGGAHSFRSDDRFTAPGASVWSASGGFCAGTFTAEVVYVRL